MLICLEDNCAKVCCIYLTYEKLMEMQTSGTNFAALQTVQKADFLIKVIVCQYHLCCDVIVPYV